MTWDYRLLAHQDELGHILYWDVHEVHYDDNGKPEYWTVEPVELMDGEPIDIINLLQKVWKDLSTTPPLLIQEDTGTLEILPLISKEG